MTLALPPELLSKIFLLSVSKPVQIPVVPYEAPWNVSLVCSKWRYVALKTPRLWNEIHVSIDCCSVETEEICGTMVDEALLFLLRAGSTPISLVLEAEEDIDDFAPHACRTVLFSMMDYFHQFQSLSLVPIEQFGFLPQFGLDWGRVTILESLALTFSSGSPLSINGRDQPPAHCLKGFEHAHSLHTLLISSDHAHLELQVFTLPWSQLTRLAFNQTTIPFTEGHLVLRQCVNLVSLRLGITSNDECDLSHPDTLLPHLESLTIFVDMEDEYGQFLEPFVLPSLKCLEIESEDESIWPDEASGMLRADSLQNLEQLKVTHMEPAAVHAFLVDTPSLIRLSIHSLSSSDTVEELTEAIGDGDLVPLLQVLECDASMADSLPHILEARAKVASQEDSRFATIRSVIIYGNLTDTSTNESLTLFHSQGVDVEYRDVEED